MWELEVLESYELFAEKRFVIRLKGTNIKFNVSAHNEDEAVRKVESLLLQRT
ncbi:hypothetical protein [Ignicoccus hospitalis]|uniref:hypothetical protein n=1 Tax=Ignicoccus hospitalis TaxID=160233 RepID=UPI0003217C85|nr:hypothetical protein [Ignicoccus hospitalis]HIH90318.1 hypothetical protein [Desulfurococcaceae archaeon]